MGSGNSGRPSEKSQLFVHGDQGPPVIPDDLVGDHARQLWTLAIESLPHVLRPLDAPILRLCCQAYELAMDAGTKCDPKRALSATRVFEALARQIGLTPSSRRVIKPAGQTPNAVQDSPFEEWQRRGGLN